MHDRGFTLSAYNQIAETPYELVLPVIVLARIEHTVHGTATLDAEVVIFSSVSRICRVKDDGGDLITINIPARDLPFKHCSGDIQYDLLGSILSITSSPTGNFDPISS